MSCWIFFPGLLHYFDGSGSETSEFFGSLYMSGAKSASLLVFFGEEGDRLSPELHVASLSRWSRWFEALKTSRLHEPRSGHSG